MESSCVVNIHLVTHLKLSLNQSPSSEDETFDMKCVSYVFVVGSLLYTFACKRPNITHVIGIINRFLSNPGREH